MSNAGNPSLTPRDFFDRWFVFTGAKKDNSMADSWAQEQSYGAKGGAGQDKVTRLLNVRTQAIPTTL